MTTTQGFEATGVAGKDRATGLIIGMAVGDALGAGFEFAPAVAASDVYMKGGGLGDFNPGEWTDDTSMAIPLLEAVAGGRDLLATNTVDLVAQRWAQWYRVAPDVGNTTSAVLSRYDPNRGAPSLREAANQQASAGLACGGNGSLMRTAPVTLGFLDRPDELAVAARLYSDLTHGDPDAGDACVLMTHAQRHAILQAEFDIRVGLPFLPEGRQRLWEERLSEAEQRPAASFTRNGWVVGALQAAWSSIVHCEAEGAQHFELTLRDAVSIGHDTDTVAAIAGSLLGARWGVSAIPLPWRAILHGWPGLDDAALLAMVGSGLAGRPWPEMFEALAVPTVAHPCDEAVLLGGLSGLAELPDDVEVVVSLCRIGTRQGPNVAEHHRVWLIDSPDPAANPHLDYVIQQAVNVIVNARQAGKMVFVHCLEGRSRTPLVAAAYASATTGDDGLSELGALTQRMVQAAPNQRFVQYLASLGGRVSSAVVSNPCDDEGTTMEPGA